MSSEDESDSAWEFFGDQEAAEAREKAAIDPDFSWLRPCQDIAIGTTVYMWFRFEPLDSLVPCGSGPMLGDCPTWLEPGWLQDHTLLEIMELWKASVASFLIELGIAPGQPFLVELQEPEHYRCSYEYDEWDIRYNWRIVRALPLDPKKAARRWQAYQDDVARAEAKALRYREHFERMCLTHTNRWRLDQRIHKDYNTGVIKSVSMHLEVRPGKGLSSKCLAQGYSPHGNESLDATAAFKELIASFKQRHPQLSTDIVFDLLCGTDFKMPVGFNQWDRLAYGFSVI